MARVAMVCRLSAKLAKPVFLWAIGVEHIRTWFGRRQVRQLQAARVITVRDERSAQILAQHGLLVTGTVGDPAAALPPGNPERGRALLGSMALSPPGGDANRQVGICLAVDGPLPKADCRALADVADRLSAERTRIILFSSEVRRGYDEVAARWISRHTAYPVTVLPCRHLVTTDFQDFLATLDLVISSRMHPILVAAGNGIPVIPICRSPKTGSLARTLGLPVVADSGNINPTDIGAAALAILNGRWPGDAVAGRVRSYRQSARHGQALFAQLVAGMTGVCRPAARADQVLPAAECLPPSRPFPAANHSSAVEEHHQS